MSWPLCSAVARCQVRRLRERGAANPLAALAVVAVAAVAPFACVRLGSALGGELRGSLGDGVAAAIAAGPVLAAAVAGSALATSLSGRSALGAQVAAAPFRGRDAVVAECLVPVFGGGVLLLGPLFAFATSMASALDRDAVEGVALALATLAAVPGGAALAEGILGALGSAWRQAGVVGAGVAAWALVGWKLGTTALGPLAPAATALREGESSAHACAWSFVALLGLVCAWVELAARRPERKRRAGSSSIKLVRRRGAVPGAVLALLVRRTDVRLSAAAAVGFGLGGVLLATVTDAPAPAAFMLGTTTALLGCIVPSLATCGAVCVGRWLWLAAPCPSATIGRSAWGVALVLTTLPAAVVGGVALAVSAASWSAVGTVAIVVVLAADTAAIAGVLVPWRGGAGDQLATFAAFGALAIATSLAIGVVAPRLVAFGLPDAAVALAACLGCSATATVALRRGLEGARA